MLNIYFGDMPEAVYNTAVYFNYTYEDEWLTSDFAKEVIKKIDKSNVLGPHAIESPVFRCNSAGEPVWRHENASVDGK